VAASLHGNLHIHDQAIGGTVFDRYSPTTIIGVETSGDTAAVCHYLDPGDGSGIEAALAAAPGGNFVLRRGFIDLNAGPVTAPFAIPAGAIFQCSGGSVFGTIGTPGTYIQARDSGDQGVFIVGEGAVLRDCAVGVPLPVAATAGSLAVVDAAQVAYAQIHNVAVQFQGNLTAGPAANLTLRYAFRTTIPLNKTTPWLGVDYRNCYAQAIAIWSLRELSFGEDFFGFLNTGFAGGVVAMDRGSQYDECSVESLDIGFRCYQSRCAIRQPNTVYCRTDGIQLSASGCESHGGQVIVAGAGTGDNGAAIIAVGDLSAAVIADLFVEGESTTCVRIVSGNGLAVERCIIHVCRTANGTIGLLLDANGGVLDRTIVIGNQLDDNTTPFTDGGTNTVDVGNVLV